MTNTLDLEAQLTQRDFCRLTGAGPGTVSDLAGRGILKPGATAGDWLFSYCTHLRDRAGGRSDEADLSTQRALLAKVQRERQELALEVERGTYADVAMMGRQLARIVAILANEVHSIPRIVARADPTISQAVLKVIQGTIAKACDSAVEQAIRAMPLDDEDEEGQALAPIGKTEN